LRVIIVVVQRGPVKTYVATVEALRKKERQDETQFTTKIESHPMYDQNQGSGAVFSLLYR
jgi:hypothetical protein